MDILDELKQIQREIEDLNRRSARLLDQLAGQISGPVSDRALPTTADFPSDSPLEQASDPPSAVSAHPASAPEVEGSIFDLPEDEGSFEESSWDDGVEVSWDSPISIYTDGACSGNPGPAGSGVVVIQNEKVIHEISKPLGVGTNNSAELTAIKLALEFLEDHYTTPVTIYTDSTYSIGMLTKNWKARANVELVGAIRHLMKPFKRLKLAHVKGHSGHPGNERADRLAVKGSAASCK